MSLCAPSKIYGVIASQIYAFSKFIFTWIIIFSCWTHYFFKSKRAWGIHNYKKKDQSVQVYEVPKAWGILVINSTQFSGDETIYKSIFLLLWILEYQNSRMRVKIKLLQRRMISFEISQHVPQAILFFNRRCSQVPTWKK